MRIPRLSQTPAILTFMLFLSVAVSGSLEQPAAASEPTIKVLDGDLDGVSCTGTMQSAEDEDIAVAPGTGINWGVQVAVRIIAWLTGVGQNWAYKDYGEPYQWEVTCTANTVFIGTDHSGGENRRVTLFGVDENGEPIEATCTYSGASSFDEGCAATADYSPSKEILYLSDRYEPGSDRYAPQTVDVCLHPDVTTTNSPADAGAGVIDLESLLSDSRTISATFAERNPDGVCEEDVVIQYDFTLLVGEIKDSVT